jgi:hypothetical protein
MARISFFQMLVGNTSWIERSAINSAHDRADAAMDIASVQGDAFGSAISQLHRTVAQQQQRIVMLESMIGVLAAVLRDNNVIDPEILDARLEAAVLNAEEEMVQVSDNVLCTRCSKMVPKAQSNMTEAGLVCDRCLATG